MAKKKIKTNTEPVESAELVFSFPTRSRCPRCGATDTICQHTDNANGRQYRQCQRAICKHKYCVQGTKI